MGGCRAWEDAFGTRFDVAALRERVKPPDQPPTLTISADWEPVWRRAREGTLHGGDVVEKTARGEARALASMRQAQVQGIEDASAMFHGFGRGPELAPQPAAPPHLRGPRTAMAGGKGLAARLPAAPDAQATGSASVANPSVVRVVPALPGCASTHEMHAAQPCQPSQVSQPCPTKPEPSQSAHSQPQQ